MITEEQRDRLLDLCQTSKDVSLDYDKVSEINDEIQSLPKYLREEYRFPNVWELSDNIDEKLADISKYINEELI